MSMLAKFGAMQFYSEKFSSSYGFAQRFAGMGGHIATLPEIISARAKVSLDHPVWDNWYTTSSVEYYGRSRGGNDIVIVAHGDGPIQDMTTIEEAYQPKRFRDDRPECDEGHISDRRFRALENGDYGDVTVIEYAAVKRAYEYGCPDYVRRYDAVNDPLLIARLGPDWQIVLEKLDQETRARGWLKRRNLVTLPPYTLKSSTPFLYDYDAGCGPYAHLLSVTDWQNMGYAGTQFASMEVREHQRTSGKRFIGVRQAGDILKLHQGPEILRSYAHEIILPYDSGDSPLPAFFAVREFGGKWFTCTRKEGYELDSGWPEFPVLDIEPLGGSSKIFSANEEFFFRYDMADVMLQAPPGANAYYVGEPRRAVVGGERGIEADIHFCRVVVDMERQCVTQRALDGGYSLRMTLLERLERDLAFK